MRKAADLQEEVMNKGLDINAIPKTLVPQMNIDDPMATGQLPGYG